MFFIDPTTSFHVPDLFGDEKNMNSEDQNEENVEKMEEEE